MSWSKDRNLGMYRDISRRDFVNGVEVTYNSIIFLANGVTATWSAGESAARAET